MSKTTFTDKEKKQLSGNPYIKKVITKGITKGITYTGESNNFYSRERSFQDEFLKSVELTLKWLELQASMPQVRGGR